MEKTASRSTKRKQRDDDPQIERHRREKMSEHYSTLQSMVPNLFPKATRTRIVDETINYINFLEHVIMALKSQRRTSLGGPPLLLTQQNSLSTVEVSLSRKTAYFSISFVSRPISVARILEVFERYQAEVLAASVVSDFGVTRIDVTSVVLEEGSLEKIKMDLLSV